MYPSHSTLAISAAVAAASHSRTSRRRHRSRRRPGRATSASTTRASTAKAGDRPRVSISTVSATPARVTSRRSDTPDPSGTPTGSGPPTPSGTPTRSGSSGIPARFARRRSDTSGEPARSGTADPSDARSRVARRGEGWEPTRTRPVAHRERVVAISRPALFWTLARYRTSGVRAIRAPRTARRRLRRRRTETRAEARNAVHRTTPTMRMAKAPPELVDTRVGRPSRKYQMGWPRCSYVVVATMCWLPVRYGQCEPRWTTACEPNMASRGMPR
jgi:hypothetical protein